MVFGRKRDKFQFDARTPEGLRLYAIGDIHGRLDLMETLLEDIAADAGAEPYRLIFLGDYIDRGPASARIIERLIHLKAQRPADIILLKGNHEQAMLDFIAAPEETAGWIEWGGDATLESYGVGSLDREPEALRDDLLASLPDSHFRFLMDLEAWHTAGDYIFVHAGMRKGVPLENQQEQDLLWIRDAFFNLAPGSFGNCCIVHGHTPSEETPLDLGWRVNVDTGAVWTGRLTALVMQGKSRRFLST